jgi:hypothetical protein
MARLRVTAAFLRRNMPFDLTGVVDVQTAYDVAGRRDLAIPACCVIPALSGDRAVLAKLTPYGHCDALSLAIVVLIGYVTSPTV